jgi:hypothetical protein
MAGAADIAGDSIEASVRERDLRNFPKRSFDEDADGRRRHFEPRDLSQSTDAGRISLQI